MHSAFPLPAGQRGAWLSSENLRPAGRAPCRGFHGRSPFYRSHLALVGFDPRRPSRTQQGHPELAVLRLRFVPSTPTCASAANGFIAGVSPSTRATFMCGLTADRPAYLHDDTDPLIPNPGLRRSEPADRELTRTPRLARGQPSSSTRRCRQPCDTSKAEGATVSYGARRFLALVGCSCTHGAHRGNVGVDRGARWKGGGSCFSVPCARRSPSPSGRGDQAGQRPPPTCCRRGSGPRKTAPRAPGAAKNQAGSLWDHAYQPVVAPIVSVARLQSPRAGPRDGLHAIDGSTWRIGNLGLAVRGLPRYPFTLG